MDLLGFVLILSSFIRKSFFFFFFFLKLNIQFLQIIELGHQGEPVTDVILRIYRQTERGDPEKKREEIRGLGFISKKEIKRGGGSYSKRYSLGDDCDEVQDISFFIECVLCFLIFPFIQQEISCSYYEGEGILSTAGCETVDVTDEYVDCAYALFFSFPHPLPYFLSQQFSHIYSLPHHQL